MDQLLVDFEKLKPFWKLILGYSLAAIAVATFFWGNHEIEVFKTRSIASQEWPTVNGRIIESRIAERVSEEDDGTRNVYYVVLITYEYVVDDIRYASNQIGWEDDGYRSSMAEAQELVISYPKDEMITVHYDPDKPRFSLLDVTLPEQTDEIGIGYFIASGAILAIAFALIYAHLGKLLRIPGWVLIIGSMIIFGGGGILTAAINVYFSILVGFGFVLFIIGGIVRNRR